MKRNKKQIDVVYSDWKDVHELLKGIARVIKRRTGLTLQIHDIGTDDWIVSIGPKRITVKALLKEMGWDDMYEVIR